MMRVINSSGIHAVTVLALPRSMEAIKRRIEKSNRRKDNNKRERNYCTREKEKIKRLL